MGMKYNQEEVNKAFALYVNGAEQEEIADALGVARNTITTWKKKFNWEAQLKDVQEKTKEILVTDIAQIRARQIKICQAIQSKFIERLKLENNINAQDADRAMKHELLLLGEATDRKEINGENADTFAKIYNEYHGTKIVEAGSKG